MSEDLADYLREIGIKVHFIHSDVETFERIDILRDLRLGIYDVVVGINLLREGLDLPEVSLVCILDADKEGYLRSETALIQTIGRAARHETGRVIMYADHVTDSMDRAIKETYRRREAQIRYNEERGITPKGIIKAVRDISPHLRQAVAETPAEYRVGGTLQRQEVLKLIKELEAEMKRAARELEYEQAALLRDQISQLRQSIS
jgi:excinuclease ABC subunit B